MPEYMDDPSQLTKDKLKSELLAHNVELPSGNHNKDVYVQLYLENLTAQNKKRSAAATLDAFSSDEELPPPVVSSRSRSSGRKAPRKTDKIQTEELDVAALTDEYLRDELLKHGVDAGPIVASTRKLYEKKLKKLLDDGPAQATITKIVVTEIQVNQNGNSESDLYSDKEDDVIAEPDPEPVAEPEPEPEPVPVVDRPIRSRGKTPVTTRTHSSGHKTLHHKQVATEALLNTALLEEEFGPLTDRPIKRRQLTIPNFLSKCSPAKARRSTSSPFKENNVSQVEKIAAGDQTHKVVEKDVLKELFSNDVNSPTGIVATCRRPIRGAAGRPVRSSDLWNDENSYFSPKATKTISNSSSSSYTESRVINRVNSLPNSSSSSSKPLSSTPLLLSSPPPTGAMKAASPGMSLWKKVLLLAIVVAFLFFIYQAMETNTLNPFSTDHSEVASGGRA
ncbi:thymopoietin a isoform X1 [Syngnathoides biaculeatus]|uniref:thymopoietin a isoform X1 n=1 Tax=Syngnathoides biaculeatus TaxID=300417 RepID=UPI002ADE50D8|nr:thymopoietin a isoform X1 [Syngnathoides biaculeatus]